MAKKKNATIFGLDSSSRSVSRRRKIQEPIKPVEPAAKPEAQPMVEPSPKPMVKPPPTNRPVDRPTININIKRMSEQKLLDSKLMRKKSRVASRIIYTLIFLGILTGAGFFVYYRFYSPAEKIPSNDFSGDEIIVPDLPEPEEDIDAPDEEATPVAEEKKLSFGQLLQAINALEQACSVGDCQRLRALLLELPTDYQPQHGICDEIWQAKEARVALVETRIARVH